MPTPQCYNYRMDLNLIQQLLQNCKIQPDLLLVVGVSGGSDSLCLLDLLCRLGYPVLAAHYNHQIRPEAEADEKAVQELAAIKKIPFVVGRGNVCDFAQRRGLSMEEAARKMRYTFLFEQARLADAQAVTVAHHAGDQVETILMHFLRGSGISGLRGMQMRIVLPEWDATIPLIRPLLGVERQEIEAYCLEHGLEPRQDKTNADVRYFRNRLRHELIPEIETYNPKFTANMLRMGEVLAGEENLLEELTVEAWQESCRLVNPAIVQISPNVFAGYSRPLQRRVLRTGVSKLLPDLRDLDFESVERCLDFLAIAPHRGRVDVVDGLRLEADLDAWFLMKNGVLAPATEFPQIKGGQEIVMPAMGEVELDNGWWIIAESVPRPDLFDNLDKSKIWLDADLWKNRLIIRGGHRGERFQPLGMAGKSIKLADFFTNDQLPRRARAGWPLLATESEIIWVVGKRAGEAGKLFPETRNVICLKLMHR